MEIKNKVAIITGGVGGIGFATVELLLKNELKYIAIFDLPDADDKKVEKKLNILKENFDERRFGYYKCDVTNHTEFKACYKQVLDSKKYVDILINNAGILSDKNVDKNIDVNYKAVVKGTLMAIDHMTKDKGGVVVNIGSTAGLNNHSLIPVYNASKHAVVSFVRSMKENCATLGVRVVCICPHLTDGTNLYDQWEKIVLPFVNKDIIPVVMEKHTFQRPESVGYAVVEIIKKGEAGAVWLVKDDERPRGIKDINEAIELVYDLPN